MKIELQFHNYKAVLWKLIHNWKSLNYFFYIILAFGKLSVSIETDPPGPVYIAATWIQFHCIVDERAEEPITYHWYEKIIFMDLHNYLHMNHT